MVKFELNLHKKYIYFLLLILVIVGIGYSIAQTVPNPGHPWGQVEGLPNPATICTSGDTGDGNCLDQGSSGGVTALTDSDGLPSLSGAIKLLSAGTASITFNEATNSITIGASGSGGIVNCGVVQLNGGPGEPGAEINCPEVSPTSIATINNGPQGPAGPSGPSGPSGGSGPPGQPGGMTSIDGVANIGGDIDLVAGSGITINPDDTNNRITFTASGGGCLNDQVNVGGTCRTLPAGCGVEGKTLNYDTATDAFSCLVDDNSGGGVWTINGGAIIHPTDTSDAVAIGTNGLSGNSEKLRVFGNVYIDGNLITGNLQSASNLDFDGELMPDGAICANGQILKKTGGSNWDCVDIPLQPLPIIEQMTMLSGSGPDQKSVACNNPFNRTGCSIDCSGSYNVQGVWNDGARGCGGECSGAAGVSDVTNVIAYCMRLIYP